LRHSGSPLQLVICIVLLLAEVPAVAQEEYNFDLSGYEKSPFELDGYAEFRWEHLRLNDDAALYRLNLYGEEQLDAIDRFTASLQLEGRYRQDKLSAYIRINPDYYTDDLGNDGELVTHEAYASWQVKTGIALDAGKKLVKWGKGYAWNPVGFIERPKDPNEPDLAREGFTMVSADWITSFTGDLQTIAITPVYLPVTDDFNKDFGPEDDNFAARVYLLYRDTDIDVMFLSDDSRTARYGIDFSRNISTNFEIHGEWAYVTDFKQRMLNDLGGLDTTVKDVQSWLLGLRYLTQRDTTYIVEYYFNGTGFTQDQMAQFYQLVDAAPDAPNPDAAIAAARAIASAGYVKQTVMREYLYIRAMQKEPFDWLYWTPAITAIINLEDKSYNVAPEVTFTGITNFELRAKINVLNGDDHSEFGEKQNDSKVEIRLRYYF
jgi:hypothetical protein